MPLYYDARGEKLGVAISDLNERIAAKLEELEQLEIEDIDVAQRLEQELKREYHVITAEPSGSTRSPRTSSSIFRPNGRAGRRCSSRSTRSRRFACMN